MAIPRMQRPSFVIEAKILRLLVLVVLILVRFFFVPTTPLALS